MGPKTKLIRTPLVHDGEEGQPAQDQQAADALPSESDEEADDDRGKGDEKQIDFGGIFICRRHKDSRQIAVSPLMLLRCGREDLNLHPLRDQILSLGNLLTFLIDCLRYLLIRLGLLLYSLLRATVAFGSILLNLPKRVARKRSTKTNLTRQTTESGESVMPTTFPFSEERIRKLKPPADRDREYHKDKTYPGLQVCVTTAGSKTYYLVKRTDGRPTRHKLGTADELSVDQARKAAAAVAGKIASGENPQADRRQKREEPTLQKLHAHWMIYANAHKKASSTAEDRRNFAKHCKPLAGRRLGSIKKADVQRLHTSIGSDSGPYAANRVLALLKAMYNKADELGYRGDNPCRGVKKFSEVARDRFLQAGEAESFFAALQSEPELFRDFFLMLLLTGARKSNVLSMRWADLDLQASYWRIPETKSGSVVVVPLVAPAVTILEKRQAAANGCPWVFPGHRKNDHLHSPLGAWQRISKAAKLENLRPHDLRRSLGSWMAGQNVSLTIIGKVLGHKTPQATMIYSRLAMDPQRSAMEGATTAMLQAGKQMKLLTIDVKAEATKEEDNGDAK